MASLQLDKEKNALSSNWEANLLVKDHLSGKLKRLRFSSYDERFKELMREEEEKKKEEEENSKKSELSIEANLHPVKLAPALPHFVPVENTVAPSAKSELHFHPEDKHQLEQMATQTPVDDSKKYSIEKIIETLLTKNNINFDGANKKIFSDLLFDYFRNRRGFLTVREDLKVMVQTNTGKLDETLIDNVLSIVRSLKAKIEVEGGLVIRQGDMTLTPKPAPVSPTDSERELKATQFRQALEEKVKISTAVENKSVPSFLQSSKKIEDNTITPTAPAFSAEPPKPLTSPSATPLVKPGFQIPREVASFKTSAAPSPSVEKKPIDSTPIKVAPRNIMSDVVKKTELPNKEIPRVRHVLTGPVQELAALSLDNYRRLGEDNAERVEKIIEKIKVLEHDSFARRSQGISAWRESPTYQNYLSLGLESMTSGQDVQKIIAAKQAKAEDTLSYDEFLAISDINKRLRF